MVSGQDPACADTAPAESGCSCHFTQLPQTGFIPAQRRKTVTLTRSILPLSENSINSAAAHSKGSDWIWVRQQSPGLPSARHQVSPTSWSTQIWSQNAAPSACLSLTGMSDVTRTSHITRKDRHLPFQNRLLFVSVPVQVSLVNSCVYSHSHSRSPYRKKNPTQLWSLSPVPMGDVGDWGCHVLSLNKETQACPSP